MLTGLWLNEWVLKALNVVCGALLRAAGVENGIPRTNQDVHWY